MLSLIATMIGAYIVTRMFELLATSTGGVIVRIVALLTLLWAGLATLGIVTLDLQSSSRLHDVERSAWLERSRHP